MASKTQISGVTDTREPGVLFEYECSSKLYWSDSLFDFYVANEIWSKVGHGTDSLYLILNVHSIPIDHNEITQ